MSQLYSKKTDSPRWLIGVIFLSTIVSGCYQIRGSKGGGQTAQLPERSIDPSDIGLPAGYTIAPVVTGLTFPTAVAYDDQDRCMCRIRYSYEEVLLEPKLYGSR